MNMFPPDVVGFQKLILLKYICLARLQNINLNCCGKVQTGFNNGF